MAERAPTQLPTHPAPAASIGVLTGSSATSTDFYENERVWEPECATVVTDTDVDKINTVNTWAAWETGSHWPLPHAPQNADVARMQSFSPCLSYYSIDPIDPKKCKVEVKHAGWDAGAWLTSGKCCRHPRAALMSKKVGRRTLSVL